jgi:hypothetical protein
MLDSKYEIVYCIGMVKQKNAKTRINAVFLEENVDTGYFRTLKIKELP